MAMEYVDGVSLAEIIRTRQPLPLADKLSYLEQICAGLHYAHGQGIVHRDIKPANLMVDRRNVVRILDFGIARVEGSGMTRDGALIGTLNYMSPEQMLGRAIDHRSDIFAFGAVAYELLAYEKAFPGSVQDGLLQRLPNEPPKALHDLCPGLPDALEAVVMRALAKQPQERFADLAETRMALRQIRRQLDPDLDLEPITTPRRGGSTSTPAPGSVSVSEPGDGSGSVQRCLADAELRLAQGEIESADGFVRQALRLDPGNAAALAMRSRIERTATSQGIVLPTVIVPKGKDPTPRSGSALETGSRHTGPRTVGSEAVAPVPSPSESLQRSSLPGRRIALIGAAAAAAVIVGGVLWITSLEDRTPPAEPTPAARVDERPASPPPAVTPPPAIPAPAPAPVVDAERVLQDQLTRIDAAYRKGDLEGALVEMRPVLARTTDTRARTLARTIASDARSTMTTAAAAARKQKAATLSPVAFGTAERARAASEDAFNRNDFVEAGIQALRASANYSFAEREAAVAAAKVVTPPPAAPRTADIERAPTPSPGALPTPSAAPAVVVANPPPAPVPVPQPPPVVSLPQPPPAAAPTPAAAAPPARASAIEIPLPGRLPEPQHQGSAEHLSVIAA
jgi:serine/threonine protein kinase